jgi:hypothetical protein
VCSLLNMSIWMHQTVPHQPQISSICHSLTHLFAICRIWLYILCFVFNCVLVEKVCGFFAEVTIFARTRLQFLHCSFRIATVMLLFMTIFILCFCLVKE